MRLSLKTFLKRNVKFPFTVCNYIASNKYVKRFLQASVAQRFDPNDLWHFRADGALDPHLQRHH